jgi:hypothetical protein
MKCFLVCLIVAASVFTPAQAKAPYISGSYLLGNFHGR